MPLNNDVAPTATDRALRILAVSPRFAPTNGADTHRLRLLVSHASSAGWKVEVLCVEPSDDIGPTDPWLAKGLPADIAVHRVRALPLRGWGLRGLAQRSIWPLYRRGSELLATGRFDLVFFSTTEFAVHLLGPLWRRRSGVPFCMDYQDPWVADFYRRHPNVVPPGGRMKFMLADRFHRIAERIVAPACSGFLSVSQDYLDDLVVRYGETCRRRPWLVRPFPAEPTEMGRIGAACPDAPADSSLTAIQTWRYVGAIAPHMLKSASGFFEAWLAAMDCGLVVEGDIRFQARGTSYARAGSGAKTLAPIMASSRLAPWVEEDPDRLSYSATLAALVQSSALVVFGSDEPAYTASKIYPYLMSGKPVLALFHKRSPVVELIRAVGGAVCVTFDEATASSQLADAILDAWFRRRQYDRPVPLDRAALRPFTAATQAREIGSWFRSVVNGERAQPT